MEVLPQKGDFFRFTGATLASEPLFRYTSIAVDHLQEYEVYIMKYQIKDGTVTLGGESWKKWRGKDYAFAADRRRVEPGPG